jgi:hypothetical protein
MMMVSRREFKKITMGQDKEEERLGQCFGIRKR